MKAKTTERKRIALQQSDKVILGIVAAMVVLIIVLNVLQRVGLSLVNGDVMLHLPVLALLTLVGWGIYVLVRRISSRTVKLIVGGVLVLVVLLVVMVATTYIRFVSAITVPQKYATVSSPSGSHKLVVLRALDPDEDRIEQRKAARLAADPDGEQEPIAADWGYIYRAYPQALLGLFYRSNADVEGEVCLAYSEGIIPVSEEAGGEAQAEPLPRGTLMLEWLEDESVAHFFVQDPGVAEGGECTVRF